MQFANGGSTKTKIAVTLYDKAGQPVGNYTVTVPPGRVMQDLQPFANRANKPNIGWGFVMVTINAGENVRVSASVVDAVTGDAMTVPPKR